MRFVAILLCFLLSLPAQASDLNDVIDGSHDSLRVGLPSAFGETGTYELTNIFSYQSTFGLSYRRDVQTTSGTGSIGTNNGYIQLKTGTTSGGTAQVDTVERGQYQPGKGGDTGNAQSLSSVKGRRIPLVGTNPTCLVAIAPGGADATVTSAVRVVEEW